ncbi:hypothetical protein D9M68_402400 [compost metagenome]
MADAEGVVFAFHAAREGGDAVLLAQGAHLLTASGEDLVRVGLVAHVPDQPVVRRVVDVVQGDGQFHHAEAGTEMPAGLADGVKEVLAQFVGQGFQLRVAKPAQLVRRRRAVEQGRDGAFAGDLVERRGHQAYRYGQKKMRQFT